MLDIFDEAKRKGQDADNAWKVRVVEISAPPAVWKDIVVAVAELKQPGPAKGMAECKNHYRNVMCAYWTQLKVLFGKSGFGWDTEKHMVTVDSAIIWNELEVWEEKHKVSLKKWKTKSWRWHERVDALKSQTTVTGKHAKNFVVGSSGDGANGDEADDEEEGEESDTGDEEEEDGSKETDREVESAEPEESSKERRQAAVLRRKVVCLLQPLVSMAEGVNRFHGGNAVVDNAIYQFMKDDAGEFSENEQSIIVMALADNPDRTSAYGRLKSFPGVRRTFLRRMTQDAGQEQQGSGILLVVVNWLPFIPAGGADGPFICSSKWNIVRIVASQEIMNDREARNGTSSGLLRPKPASANSFLELGKPQFAALASLNNLESAAEPSQPDIM
ncbi:hypothetical protein V8E36_006721 [Tilletia maclaganii]